jgi:preprotein translocase subunit SecE
MTTPEEDKQPDDTEESPPGELDPSGRATSAGESMSLREPELTNVVKVDEGLVTATVNQAVTQAGDDDEDEMEEVDAPVQLGGQRFVYAAYFAGGIAVAFMLSKAATYTWTRLALWKPQLGEPHDEIVMPVAALVGALVAFYYYRDDKTRTLAEEVATELGNVTWPSRTEVTNSTFVVIVTTLIATTFFALMDRFWGFVTNLVYGA